MSTEQKPLSEIIGHYIRLEKFGREFRAPCPFHSEATPSFSVNDQKGFYHCFGCGAHGNETQFVMEYLGMEFMPAREELSTQFNIPIPTKYQQNKKIKEKDTRWPYLWKRVLGAFDFCYTNHFTDEDKKKFSTLLDKKTTTEYNVGWSPKMDNSKAYWETVLPQKSDQDRLKRSRLLGDRMPMDALIIPVSNKKEVLGFYSLDKRKYVNWYGQHATAPWLYSGPAKDADYKTRQSAEIWVTDNLESFLKLSKQVQYVAVIPWPAIRYSAQYKVKEILQQWDNINILVTHDTHYLFDHPLIDFVLPEMEARHRVQMGAGNPGDAIKAENLMPVEEFLVSRSLDGVVTELAGARDRFRRLAARWYTRLPESMYKFVIGEHLRRLDWTALAQSKGNKSNKGRVPHPLSWAPEMQSLLIQARTNSNKANENLIPTSIEGGLIRKVLSGKPLTRQEKNIVDGMLRDAGGEIENKKKEVKHPPATTITISL